MNTAHIVVAVLCFAAVSQAHWLDAPVTTVAASSTGAAGPAVPPGMVKPKIVYPDGSAILIKPKRAFGATARPIDASPVRGASCNKLTAVAGDGVVVTYSGDKVTVSCNDRRWRFSCNPATKNLYPADVRKLAAHCKGAFRPFKPWKQPQWKTKASTSGLQPPAPTPKIEDENEDEHEGDAHFL